jgi:hypothetical protein
MAKPIWTFARLDPEQERALKEAEETLGGGVLLVFEKDGVEPSELNESQIECLQGLERKLGKTIVAVRPRQAT